MKVDSIIIIIIRVVPPLTAHRYPHGGMHDRSVRGVACGQREAEAARRADHQHLKVHPRSVAPGATRSDRPFYLLSGGRKGRWRPFDCARVVPGCCSPADLGEARIACPGRAVDGPDALWPHLVGPACHMGFGAALS